jgi:hypothetical protein
MEIDYLGIFSAVSKRNSKYSKAEAGNAIIS